MPRKLQDEMRRPAESGQPEQLAVTQPGEGEGAVADGAGAEQRRRLLVREGVGDDVGVIFAHRHVLGVAAVHIPAGCPKRGAQVLVCRPGRSVDPTDAHPVADSELPDARADAGHVADHLVPEDDRQARRRRAPFDLVELRVTDAARRDADEDLGMPRLGHGQIVQLQRRVDVVQRHDPPEHHRSHRFPPQEPFDFRDQPSSRCTVAGEKAGTHTATYSAPPGSGLL